MSDIEMENEEKKNEVIEPIRLTDDRSIIEIFDSTEELLRVCDNRELNGWVSASRAARGRKTDSFVPKTYQETIDLMRYGSNEDAEALHQKILEADDLFGWNVSGAGKQITDVRGYAPSVPRALRNLPKSMYRRENKPKKGKIINIVYDMAVNCGVSAEQQAQKGAEIVSVIQQLERLGYRVRLDIMAEFADSGIMYVMRVKIKSEWNPLDIKKLAGIMTNVCFQRRVAFDWYERLPGAKYMSGYGTPFMNSSGAAQKFKSTFLKSNEYYINFSSDLNTEFREKLTLDNIEVER